MDLAVWYILWSEFLFGFSVSCYSRSVCWNALAASHRLRTRTVLFYYHFQNSFYGCFKIYMYIFSVFTVSQGMWLLLVKQGYFLSHCIWNGRLFSSSTLMIHFRFQADTVYLLQIKEGFFLITLFGMEGFLSSTWSTKFNFPIAMSLMIHFRFQAEQFVYSWSQGDIFFITQCLEWKPLSLVHEILQAGTFYSLSLIVNTRFYSLYWFIIKLFSLINFVFAHLQLASVILSTLLVCCCR